MFPPVTVPDLVASKQVLGALRYPAAPYPRQHDKALISWEVRRRDLAGQRIPTAAPPHVLRGHDPLDHDTVAGMVELGWRYFDHWVIAFKLVSGMRELKTERREK